jgi:hypothetical protein
MSVVLFMCYYEDILKDQKSTIVIDTYDLHCARISYFYLAKNWQTILPTQHCLLILLNDFSLGAYALLSVF